MALSIREKALGPNHPDVASSHGNLGIICWGMGDVEGARHHLELALSMQEKTLGPDHPVVAAFRESLDITYDGIFDI